MPAKRKKRFLWGTSIPDADSETDESLSQQVGLDTTEQAGEGQENEDAKTVSEYLQDMDYLHQIMRSEDYKKLNENMIATLKILGITEFSDGDEEQNISYASLQLWLRNFVEENHITFDELFTPPKGQIGLCFAINEQTMGIIVPDPVHFCGAVYPSAQQNEDFRSLQRMLFGNKMHSVYSIVWL